MMMMMMMMMVMFLMMLLLTMRRRMMNCLHPWRFYILRTTVSAWSPDNNLPCAAWGHLYWKDVLEEWMKRMCLSTIRLLHDNLTICGLWAKHVCHITTCGRQIADLYSTFPRLFDDSQHGQIDAPRHLLKGCVRRCVRTCGAWHDTWRSMSWSNWCVKKWHLSQII